MKKFIVILLAAILCLSIVACADEPVETTDAPVATDAPTNAPTDPPTDPTDAPTEPKDTSVDNESAWAAVGGSATPDTDPSDNAWVNLPVDEPVA